MKNIRTFLASFLLFSVCFVNAQNTLSVADKQVNVKQNFSLPITLTNSDSISALQFDITTNKKAIEIVTNHTVSARAQNHKIAVNNLAEGVIRVLIYSDNNSLITGTTGEIAQLKCLAKTTPGDYSVSISNIVLSSNKGKTLQGSGTSGSITLIGSLMQLETKTINFGRVPQKSTATTQTAIIKNIGNAPLKITGVNAIPPFVVKTAFPITINQGGSKTVEVSLTTANKFKGNKGLRFINNDSDALRNIQEVDLQVDVYAVNELKIGKVSGVINSEINIPVIVENMESFTGFQFDIKLPNGINYIPNSISKSVRVEDHKIEASLINETTVRFIGYSPTNKNFKNNRGEVFNFKIKPKIDNGTHLLTVANPVISNKELGNIVSDVYQGQVQITAPILQLSTSNIDYGNMPTTETRTTKITLTNTGGATLVINSIVNPVSSISFSGTLPITIAPNKQQEITLTFAPKASQEVNTNISFRHNGASEQNILSVKAKAFSPNYLRVFNKAFLQNTIDTLQVLLQNTEKVRAVQFDVKLPTKSSLKISELAMTSRSQGFSVTGSKQPNGAYRILLYTTTNKTLLPNDTPILKLPVEVTTTPFGKYPIDFTNVVISNDKNKDVSSIALQKGNLIVSEKLDDDEDGVENSLDKCPNTPSGETVNADGCSESQLDDDNDGVMNNIDKCPNTPQGEKVDANGCSQSQLDDDKDGVMNNIDKCPNTPQGETVNADGCSQSQLDDDKDGVMNNIDKCPNTPQGETVNADGCSQSQLDDDKDGVMNNIDKCPNTPQGEKVDANGCSQSQLDDDNDGVMNNVDRCPNTPKGETVDSNGCSASQLDDDDDNDGVKNSIDKCPNTPKGEKVDTDGCSQSQLDDDNDGVMNNIDKCPNTPQGEKVDANGCSQSQLDDDKDGVMNNIDKCPNTPQGEKVDADGCSASQLDGDDDNDGVKNSIDKCPNTPKGEKVDADGCSESQLDDDKDGVMNNIDKCPNTPKGEKVDTDGCSASQLGDDDDNDGVKNSVDKCPNTPQGEKVDADGCSQSQLDDDNDGVMNNVDKCPNTPQGETVNANGCVTINPNAIKISWKSPTCVGKKNGVITIKIDSKHTFDIDVTGTATYNFKSISSEKVIRDISAGTYNITLRFTEGIGEAITGYTVVVPNAPTVSARVNSVNTVAKTAKVSVKGDKEYTVYLNKKEVDKIKFINLNAEQTIFIDGLNVGDNHIKIVPKNECRGVVEQWINIKGDIKYYPNPTTDKVFVKGLTSKKVLVTVVNSSSSVVLTKALEVVSGKIEFSLRNVASGTYLVKVSGENDNVNLKIVKK